MSIRNPTKKGIENILIEFLVSLKKFTLWLYFLTKCHVITKISLYTYQSCKIQRSWSEIKEVLSSINFIFVFSFFYFWLVSKCNFTLLWCFLKWCGRFLTHFVTKWKAKKKSMFLLWKVTIMIMSWTSSNHSRPNCLGNESQQTP